MAASRRSPAVPSLFPTASASFKRAGLALLLGGVLWTGGCTVEAESEYRHERYVGSVPARATVIVEGHRHLVYVARETAVAYVVDLDTHNVLLTQPVRPGDRFVFAPEDGKALINDKTIYHENLSRDHLYRIYSDILAVPREGLPPTVREKDRDRYEDRPTNPPPPDPTVARGLKIPATAESVARGTGRITFTAPRDGEIYVRDNDGKTVVLGSTNIRGGDRFVLDPEHNKGSVEGRNELAVALVPTHEHEIFYVPYADK